MPLYNLKVKKLTAVKEKALALEKDIQAVTEENLDAVFGLQFVRSEFPIGQFRLDTLAFDKTANAFVIIEYKRDKSFSVIDQGVAYLAAMLRNKAEFILEYNHRTGASFTKASVDWDQSRIIFVARSFNVHQQNAIGFRDLAIELWEVTAFENSTILFNQLHSPEAKISVKTISKNKDVATVSNELKVISFDDHASYANEHIRDVLSSLREKILNIGSDVTETPKKVYIAYKSSTNFADVQVQKNAIRITLNVKSGELQDPKHLAIDFAKLNKGHWGNGDYEVVIKESDELPYAMELVRQAYIRQLL